MRANPQHRSPPPSKQRSSKCSPRLEAVSTTQLDTSNLDRFTVPKEKDTFLERELGLGGRFVFIYIGSLGTWYLLDEMLDFFQEAKGSISNAFFLILTQSKIGPLKERLREKKIHPRDVAFTFCPPEEVPRYLSLADAGLFFIRPFFSKLSSSPTKCSRDSALTC